MKELPIEQAPKNGNPQTVLEMVEKDKARIMVCYYYPPVCEYNYYDHVDIVDYNGWRTCSSGECVNPSIWIPTPGLTYATEAENA